MFYLVMPTEQGESGTDDLNDPPTPVATHFPDSLGEVISPATQTEEETPACDPESNQSEAMPLEQENETGQPDTVPPSHVIKSVDEIFHTIEVLTSKLRHLKVGSVSLYQYCVIFLFYFLFLRA